MASHKALGRGLDALFSSQPKAVKSETNVKQSVKEFVPHEGEIRQLAPEKIKPNRHQPRKEFKPEALDELAQSIKRHGVTQPLVVTETPEGGEFELVVGERRLRAAKLAELKTIPCLVRKFSNRQRFEVALIENLQREDLNALDEALAFDSLMKEFNLTQEELAVAVGKSRSTVANSLRFLRLHEEVQSSLRAGEITEGHAKCLAGLSEHSDQLHWLGKIKDHKLTVRDLEAHLTGDKGKKTKSSSTPSRTIPPEVKEYEEEFQRTLGRRVEIQSTGKKGWIRFAFYSPWDLDMLCKRLGLIDVDESMETKFD